MKMFVYMFFPEWEGDQPLPYIHCLQCSLVGSQGPSAITGSFSSAAKSHSPLLPYSTQLLSIRVTQTLSPVVGVKDLILANLTFQGKSLDVCCNTSSQM